MTQGQHAEELAAKAAQAVRNALEEAEAHASQIVRDAEDEAARVREQAQADAARIRERAETEARAQIDAAKKALDELGVTLAAAAAAAVPAAESAPADPEPEAAPDPAPGEPKPAPEEPPAESPGAPEAPISPPVPKPEQVVPAGGDGDDAAERLVAMKLAVDGTDRMAIEAELNDRFGAGDRSALLDDVLSRAGR